MAMTVLPFTSTMLQTAHAPRIAVVIPCYRVRAKILEVLAGIGPEIGWVIVVDDACPEHSGAHVRAHCQDPRVTVHSLLADQHAEQAERGPDHARH